MSAVTSRLILTLDEARVCALLPGEGASAERLFAEALTLQASEAAELVLVAYRIRNGYTVEPGCLRRSRLPPARRLLPAR